MSLTTAVPLPRKTMVMFFLVDTSGNTKTPTIDLSSSARWLTSGGPIDGKDQER